MGKNELMEMEAISNFVAIIANNSLPILERGKPMAKILVIEDEETVRDNIWELLDAEGFETLVAENGCIGVELATQALPDLILCDLRMPELDGYGVLKALRSDPTTAAIPVLFVTARASQAELSYGMGLGANAYITKPFSLSELLAAIAQVLSTHKSSSNN
ncbi:MAG: response regulator [Coleofasciculaceae cyanobacterium]